MNKMKIEDRRFLEEGIKRYEEARDTIIAFEQAMKEVLKQATNNRHDWKPLKGVEIKRPSASPSSQYGYWIAIEVRGKSPRGENVVLDCGLWWKWHEVGHPFIYTNYYNEPKRVRDFHWDSKGSDIRSFPAWNRTFLYLPLRKPDEIEVSLNRLLDALLKQLK